MQDRNGSLYLLASPIGNLEDITIRVLKTLAHVSCIACEDTRRTGQLLSEMQKRYPTFFTENYKKPLLISYYDEVEFKKTPEIIEHLQKGKSVALISDAGTPLISDPGYKLVQKAIALQISVIPLPGASAMVAALSASGLPSSPSLFLGFPPDKLHHREILFDSLQHIPEALKKPCTIIFYVSSHSLQSTIQELAARYPNSRATLARELTKIHESFYRGTLSELSQSSLGNELGEFVLLLEVGTSA